MAFIKADIFLVLHPVKPVIHARDFYWWVRLGPPHLVDLFCLYGDFHAVHLFLLVVYQVLSIEPRLGSVLGHVSAA